MLGSAVVYSGLILAVAGLFTRHRVRAVSIGLATAVIGLLLTGAEPSQRGAGGETAEGIVSAAGGIVAGAVSGGLTRGTRRLFRSAIGKIGRNERRAIGE